MAYLRFLTDKDYNCLATEEHMRQIIRDIPERVPQAEQRAEMQMLEYLDQYYEIEKILAVGKNIREYSPLVSYPAQVYIKQDEEIFKTLTSINGYKKPSKKKYWRHVDDYIDPMRIERAKKYSQLRMYSKGEVVMFGTEYWQCEIPHGYDGGEVHIPGVEAWKEAEITVWEPNLEWGKDQVCSYNGNYYQYHGENKVEDSETSDDSGVEDNNTDTGNTITPDQSDDLGGEEVVLTPEEDDLWGLIGEYSDELEYDYSEDARDYVVADGCVFYPILNPNPDRLEEGINITRDDPRNANVVAHMSRIALYHLHSIIAPTNIPETRRWAYEDSMQWLYNASKFKINPQLPRKRERGSCEEKVDWALETYQRDYNPNENAWLI